MSGKFVSEEIEHQIISLWLQGEKRDEIAVKTGISGGKVSNIIAKFQSNLNDAGWSLDLIPYVRETMKQMKAKGIGYNEIAKALRINAIIEKHGIPDEDLPAIQLLTDAAKKENTDPSLLGKLIVATKDLFTERNPDGKITTFYTLAQILERLNGISETKEKLKSEHGSYTAKVQQKKAEFAQLDSQFRSKELEIRKSTEARRRLATEGSLVTALLGVGRGHQRFRSTSFFF